jgi:FO synthase subunit 2
MHELLENLRAGLQPNRSQTRRLLERGSEYLDEICAIADARRREQAGEAVGYVVNRNINFTNVCVKNCKFCAFSRSLRSEEGYFLPKSEILRRVGEAKDFGATEVCVQAGLAPTVDGRVYFELCEAIHEEFPDIHIHAFSPEEVKYGAKRSGISIESYLGHLKELGLGSLPGTSAEVLVDRVRDEISPGRITGEEWREVVTTAHALGIRTTSTMMFGHVETSADITEHLFALREIQLETGGFTEFVPLAFIHSDSPMYSEELVDGVRPGPTEDESRLVYAVSRIVLGDVIPNVQASWVKHGLPFATELLRCGANDLGGTLMNESISTSAGAAHGQLMRPRVLNDAIQSIGRQPYERTTLYERMEREPDFVHPLDELNDDPNQRFGSYAGLVKEDDYRFSWDPQRG